MILLEMLSMFIMQLFCKHSNRVFYGDLIDDSEAYRGGSGKCVKMSVCKDCDKIFKNTWYIFT